MHHFNLGRVCDIIGQTASRHAVIAEKLNFKTQANAADMTRITVANSNNVHIAGQFAANRNEAIYTYLQVVPQTPVAEVQKSGVMAHFQNMLSSVVKPLTASLYSSNVNSLQQVQPEEPAMTVVQSHDNVHSLQEWKTRHMKLAIA